MFERDRALVIRLGLPGMKRDEIRATLTEIGLVVEGARKRQPRRKNDGTHSYVRVYRLFPLPDGVRAERVTADFSAGVLEVTLPMTPAAVAVKPRHVPITGDSDRSKRTTAA
jgi:HSP20 family protein